jgi:hypothetical protein
LTFQDFSGILTVLKVRDETKRTKMKMKTNWNNWTSYRKLNDEPIKARINRLRNHSTILGYVIAGLLGASAALTFVIIHQIFFVG